MKKSVFLLFIIALIGCSSTKNTQNDDPYRADLEYYLENFEKAVIEHDSLNLMKLIDKSYVREQHDEFLKGNTEQFINELFCGDVSDRDEFKCFEFKNISKMERLRIEQDGLNGYKVYYLVSDGEHTIEADWYVKLYYHYKQPKFGLVGAVG